MDLSFISQRKKAVIGALVLVLVIGGIWLLKSQGKLKGKADTGPYSISGKVYSNGKNGTKVGLSGVTVTDGKGHTTTTSLTGVYKLLALPAGDLTLTFSKDGTSWYGDVNYTYAKNKGIVDNSQISSAHQLDVYAALNAQVMSLKANYNSGYTMYYFKPLILVSRADMAVALARALGLGQASRSNANSPVFKDVPSTYPGWKEIEAAYFDDTVSGYSDGTFRPTQTVTRAQLAVFIAKALKLDTSAQTVSFFPDVPSPTYDWAIPSIEALKAEGIVTGYVDGTYKPEEKITRQQLATYLVRAFKNIAATKDGYDKTLQNFSLGGTTYSLTNDPVYMNLCGTVGKVWGTLRDPSGYPIVGAKIIIKSALESNLKYHRTSRAGGAFNFFNIPVGNFVYYVVKKDSADVYSQSYNWENLITVKSGSISRLDMTNLY